MVIDLKTLLDFYM